MSAIVQDLSISISQRRRPCVIDPALALSPFGISLVKRLSEPMELWLPREFWHILDNTHFFLCQPDALKLCEQSSAAPVWQNEEVIFRSLQEWERIRACTDPASMKLFWFGDGLCESMLPSEIEPSAFLHFDTLSRSLDKRLKAENLLTWAFRDAVALSATLSSAIILSQMGDSDSDDPAPIICQALQEWDLEAIQADSDDEWLHLERGFFRQQMVSAGLAKLRWSGLRLAVLHIVAPVAAALNCGCDEPIEIRDNGLDDVNEVGLLPDLADYWQGAKAFWYPL